MLAYNTHWRGLHKMSLFFIWFYTTRMIWVYRKEVLRANLFDEYVQLRAEELVKEREPLMKSESIFIILIKKR